VRALTRYQVFAIKEDHLSRHEKVQLVGELDAILRLMADKDANKDIEYLHCEQVYGLRRRFGTCSISPARKAIMDWMLDADAAKRQVVAVHAASHLLTHDGDVLIDPSIFRAALTSFLIGARKQILVKTATHLSRCLIAPAADESEAASQKRLGDLLFLLWIIVAVRRKAAADTEQIQANNLVRIQLSSDHRRSNRMKNNGEMAIVLRASTGKTAKIRIKLPQGSDEMEVSSAELIPLFSSNGLASVLADFENSIGRATEHLYGIPRLETLLEPYLSRHIDRVSVLREVREHSWRTFKKSFPSLTSKSFSKILETLSLMGESKDGDRMLQRLQEFERDQESKRFSELLRSRRLRFEEASYSKMLYLQASLKRGSSAEDVPVDSTRAIILSLATSLVDLCRVRGRTHAEVVELNSSASALLLPDFIVRYLCQHQTAQGSRANPGSTMTLILALENLSRLLKLDRDNLPARTSALLFQTVTSISINFITSHSRDCPTRPTSWTEKRWVCLSADDWEKINRLTDEVLATLDYEAKSKIKRLNLAVPRCGSEGLVALDPKSFYDLQQDASPLVLLITPCNGRWHQTAMTQDNLVRWFESGLQVLKSETIASSSSLQTAAAPKLEEQPGSEALETHSKHPNAELAHERWQDDILQEQTALDSEQMALETVVAFLKRVLCRRQREQVAAETVAAFVKRALRRRQGERPYGDYNSIPQAAGASSHSQMVDMCQRMMRYKLCRETVGPDGKRTLWNGNDMVAQDRGYGDAQYDRIKAR